MFDFTIFFDNTKSAKGVCRRLKKSCIVSYFDQQNTLQRSTSGNFGKSGVLNAWYTCGVNGSVEKSWSWETEVKVTSGRLTRTFVRRGADH